jgi:ribosomal protein S18 acetylase RimI-like enzyme
MFVKMEHLLDNPAWNALISGNRNLSFGNDDIKYFDAEVSPFAGFRENSPGNFQQLHDLLPYNRPVLFVAPAEIEIPATWKVLRVIHGVQMVCETAEIGQETSVDLVPLNDEHVPQMIELTQLTNPGPFASKTIDFGHYHGIFEGDQLVAMAGQRLHAFNYAEVSAVCTRPAHTGKGYARQLILNQINRMKTAGNIPYLHSKADNDRAIKVYESLGFKTRIEVWFYFMVKG